MSDTTAHIVYTGDKILISDISSLLPTHHNYPYGTDVVNPNTGKRAVTGKYYDVKSRKIEKVYYHQTAGSYTDGFLGIMNTAQFFTRDPSYRLVKGKYVWTAQGHGWPGFAYTFYVPFKVPFKNNRLVIYQCNPLSRVTWHTGGGCNENGIGIAFQGYFESRHIHNFHPIKGSDGHPSADQMICANEFFTDYCVNVLKLDNSCISGHFNHGKLTCPGDDLEELVLQIKGKSK